MQCHRCGGTSKLYDVSAKCGDVCYTQRLDTGTEHDGYVPDWLSRNGSGDYVELIVCRHCGQVQGDWPELRPETNQFRHGKVWNGEVIPMAETLNDDSDSDSNSKQ